MKSSALVALTAIVVPLSMALPSSAQVIGQQLKSSPAAGIQFIQAGQCWQKVGPFLTQYQAYRSLHEAQNRGFTTGPVFGEGGIYTNYANRRWYFMLYYLC